MLCLAITAAFISGCSGGSPSTDRKDFLREWKEKAKSSLAKSPSSKKKYESGTRKMGVVGKSKKMDFPEEKKLPDMEFNMVVSNVDLVPILRSMARSAGINIMINEKIQGKVSLNLEKAKWEDVFLSILSTQGLTYMWKGDILVILTKDEYEQHRKLEPLEVKLVQINYADPDSLKNNLVKFLQRGGNSSSSTQTTSILGSSKKKTSGTNARGNIIVDPHTNSLMIQAVKSDMDRLLPLIAKLDRPPKQIRIKAHIVEANRDTAQELGVYWNGRRHFSKNGSNASDWINGSSNTVTGADGRGEQISSAANTAYALSGFWNKGGKETLSLQLSALESEGKINILSSPSITTVDNREAMIESGREIPYQTESDGESSIEFKKAVISLQVTPHVIDDNTVKMVISTNKDEIDESIARVGGEFGNPGVITKKARTEVILFNGQTTVIGGLQKEKSVSSESGVPLLKDIPILGWFFQNSADKMEKEEMLIFITPYVLEEEEMEEEEIIKLPSNKKPFKSEKTLPVIGQRSSVGEKASGRTALIAGKQ